MSIRTFWTLFFKILGIWLILSGFTVIPHIISTIFLYADYQRDNLIGIAVAILFLLLTIGLYYIVLHLFVFKSNWIIDKLKLDKGIEEQSLNLNIKIRNILTIATIVIGGLMFVDALPVLCRQLFAYFQQKTIFGQDPESGSIILYGVKTIIGYLLMTNSRWVVNFIEKQSSSNDHPSLENKNQ